MPVPSDTPAHFVYYALLTFLNALFRALTALEHSSVHQGTNFLSLLFLLLGMDLLAAAIIADVTLLFTV